MKDPAEGALAIEPPSALAAAVTAWAAVLGPDHVLTDAAALAPYGRTTLPASPRPAAVVRPAATAEVAGVVRIANAHGVPLYPISRGRNWGYGDACPPTEGQVVVDLGRMDRILEVNEELAYAVIEPGVTQGQLSAFLRGNGHRLWLDCTGAGPEASIVGNVLERGFGHTPYGQRFHHVSGLEAVLGDGRLLRTGFGHYRAAQAAHLYPYGPGPVLDGLLTQAGIGIVTRLGLWLMPEPERFCFVVCFLHDPDDVVPAIDTLRRLRLDGTIRSVAHVANDLRAVSSGRPFPRGPAGDRAPLSPAWRERLRREAGVGAWTITAGLYGRKDQVAAARRAVARALKRRGRELHFLTPELLRVGDAVARALRFTPWGPRLTEKMLRPRKVLDLNCGIPTGHFLAGAYWRHRDGLPPHFPDGCDPAQDNCGMLWLSPVVPMSGAAVRAFLALIEPVYEAHGFDCLVTLSTVTDRALGAVMTVAYDRDDSAETERAARCYEALWAAIMDAGYVPYRVGIQSMGDLDRGSEGYWDTVAAVRHALDPRGIIAPGRYSPAEARAAAPVRHREAAT